MLRQGAGKTRRDSDSNKSLEEQAQQTSEVEKRGREGIREQDSREKGMKNGEEGHTNTVKGSSEEQPERGERQEGSERGTCKGSRLEKRRRFLLTSIQE